MLKVIPEADAGRLEVVRLKARDTLLSVIT